MELLAFYLRSTFVDFNGKCFIQKQGVCTGSCLAPQLSDLLLASLERRLKEALEDGPVLRTFRYVDDFLVNYWDRDDGVALSESLFGTIASVLREFVLTRELPVDGHLRFLDLRLWISEEHGCWGSGPRAQKTLVPHSSAHSKLVKRGVATAVLKNAFFRSCHHQMEAMFLDQVKRLQSSGYPDDLVRSRSNKLLTEERVEIRPKVRKEYRTTTVIPYVHGISHKLKRIVERSGV